MRREGLAAAIAWMVVGCYQGIDFDRRESGGFADGGDDGSAPSRDSSPDGDDEEPDEVDPSTFAELVGPSGARRLTAAEYAATVRDLLGDEDLAPQMLLPEDPRTPYDNDYTAQAPSQALVEGAELLAADAAAHLLDDRARLAEIVGCTPTGPDDAACFHELVERLGRRAFRRPLEPEEHVALASLQSLAIEADDFDVGAAAVVRAVLQHPKLLYRIEIGTPVPGHEGLFALDGYDVASRLSYLLTGSMPEDWLLDAAEAGDLDDGAGIRDAARALIDDPRTRERVARFHALWIGYETLPFGGDLAAAMRAETDAAIERVIFEEDRPWQDLLRLQETFVNADLAEIYGIEAPPEPAWVPITDPKRKGLLGQASFLSAGTDGLTTSPTQRGLLVRSRLFCQDIEPPPDVDTDEPPPEDAVCKVDILAAHAQGGCAGCHQYIDPIGFGLENYGPDGGYLSVEPDHPECVIEGKGEVVGVGEFSGPAELADLLLGLDSLDTCMVTQLYRFAMGRYRIEDYDEAFIEALLESAGEDEFRFADLVLDMVSSPAFRHRREEKEEVQ